MSLNLQKFIIRAAATNQECFLNNEGKQKQQVKQEQQEKRIQLKKQITTEDLKIFIEQFSKYLNINVGEFSEQTEASIPEGNNNDNIIEKIEKTYPEQLKEYNAKFFEENNGIIENIIKSANLKTVIVLVKKNPVIAGIIVLVCFYLMFC